MPDRTAPRCFASAFGFAGSESKSIDLKTTYGNPNVSPSMMITLRPYRYGTEGAVGEARKTGEGFTGGLSSTLGPE